MNTATQDSPPEVPGGVQTAGLPLLLRGCLRSLRKGACECGPYSRTERGRWEGGSRVRGTGLNSTDQSRWHPVDCWTSALGDRRFWNPLATPLRPTKGPPGVREGVANPRFRLLGGKSSVQFLLAGLWVCFASVVFNLLQAWYSDICWEAK